MTASAGGNLDGGRGDACRCDGSLPAFDWRERRDELDVGRGRAFALWAFRLRARGELAGGVRSSASASSSPGEGKEARERGRGAVERDVGEKNEE